jgi:hypothetical protein
MSTRFDAAPAGVLATIALAVALAGCGGTSSNGVASKPPSEIVAASKAAAVRAKSVHVISKFSQGPLTISYNLELANDGGRAQVSVLGLSYEAIRIGDTLYLKGNPAFDERVDGSAGLHVPSGVWLMTHTNSGELGGLIAVTELNGELGRLISSANTYTAGVATTTNGQPTIEVKQAGKLYSSSLYIATTGEPYPIELVKRGRETGQTTFSDWNQPVPLSAPAKTIAIK